MSYGRFMALDFYNLPCHSQYGKPNAINLPVITVQC